MGSRDDYTFANHSDVPAPLDKILPAYFRSINDPHSNEYLTLYDPDGELVLGASAKGRDVIRAFRNAMVHPINGPVVKSQHTLGKCFVIAGGAGTGQQEIIVNGSVWYRQTGKVHNLSPVVNTVRGTEKILSFIRRILALAFPIDLGT